jgi:hypothetical protein
MNAESKRTLLVMLTILVVFVTGQARGGESSGNHSDRFVSAPAPQAPLESRSDGI